MQERLVRKDLGENLMLKLMSEGVSDRFKKKKKTGGREQKLWDIKT